MAAAIWDVAPVGHQWAPEDFASTRLEQNLGVLNLPFVSAFAVANKRVACVRFRMGHKFENEDLEERVRLCFVPNQKWINDTFDRARGAYPIRVFEARNANIIYRGLHVLTGVLVGKWELTRLSDKWELEYPPVREWIVSHIKAAPPPPPAAFTKRVAPPSSAEPPAKRGPVGSSALVVQAPGQQSTRATPCAALILEWVVRDLPPDAHGAAPIQQVLQAAALALGETSPPAWLGPHLLRLIEARGLAIVEDRVVGVAVGPRPRVLTTPPLEWVRNERECNIRRAQGERLFRSKVELEHYLILRALVGSVLYENTTINIMVGDQASSYTCDFELPDTPSLEDRRSTAGGPLLVESKCEFPMPIEMHKCEQLVAQGRNVVLMYGYAGVPYYRGHPPKSLPEWMRPGLRAMTFELVDGCAHVEHEVAVWCVDGDDQPACLRPRRNSADFAWEHPRLLRLYREIRELTERHY